ncbi:MAG: hypothetical protein ACTSVW_04010 [Candidatus Njordarchaeales archaeon]
MKMFPRLSEVVKLNDFASKVYRFLEPQEYVGKLAPSLGMIIERDLNITNIAVGYEFLDPKTFIAMTYFREPLIDALRAVNTCLQSLSDAVPVISLTHAMGLGKTHFITLLYHLYTKAPLMWRIIEEAVPDQVKKILYETNYKIDVAKKTIVIVIDLKRIPLEMSPYQAIFYITKEVLNKYKVKFLENEISRKKLDRFLSFLSKAHEYEPMEAAKKFVTYLSLFAVNIPVLILVDEVYAAIFEAVQAGSVEFIDSLKNVIMFLVTLIDELRGRVPAILIYASALQDVLRWQDYVKGINKFKSMDYLTSHAFLLNKAVSYFEERTSRVAPISVRDVNEDEALEIVKRRILEFKVSNPLEIVNYDAIKNVLSEVIDERQAEYFIKELLETYPFSPLYKEFVKKLINPSYSADFAAEKLQHLRDLIKITSVVISRILEEFVDDGLISIAHIEHDDIKHLLYEGYAREWRRIINSCGEYVRYIESDLKDEILGRMLRRLISSIYIKSVTNNAWDLVNMLRSPETLSSENLDRHAILRRKLILALVGTIDLSNLPRVHEAFEKIESAPYIQFVDKAEGKYYLLTPLTNPYQLLRNIQEEEIRRLKDRDGKLKVSEAIRYLRETLERYALVSEFKSKAPLNVEFITIEDLKGLKPEFLNYLRGNNFIVFIISPINIAQHLLIDKLSENILESTQKVVKSLMNEIYLLNMFAIVIPNVNIDVLERLISSLAEIRASKIVVDMIRSDEGIRRLADRIEQSHRTLLELVPRFRSEEYFKQIVVEILNKFRERLGNYAQQLNNVAVQNFTTDFISLFRHVVSYDPSDHSIKIYDIILETTKQVKDIEKVFGSFPVWLVTTLKAKLNICDATSIRAKLIDWLKRESLSNIQVLIDGGELKYYVDSIVEFFRKGWPEIPIKPESINSIKSAIKALSDKFIPIQHQQLKMIRIIVKDNLIIVKGLVAKPPTPPPPTPIIKVKGFRVYGKDEIIIILASINSISTYTKFINVGLNDMHGTTLNLKGPPYKIREITNSIRRYIDRFRNDLISQQLYVEFIEPIEEDKAKQRIKQLGLSESKIELIYKKLMNKGV